MPDLDWLLNPPQEKVTLTLTLLVLRLSLALALGLLVAGIYHLTNGKPGAQSLGLMATLALLTVLIAMVTLVIGNSVARAFSLVGALSIVRFRTVVEDTRDTAFVIFAVAVGMATGAGYLGVLAVGIPFTALGAFLFRTRAAALRGDTSEAALTVRVGIGRNPAELFRPVFEKNLESWRLVVTATARQGAALDITYQVRLKDEDVALALVSELNGMEGVQEVELRQE